jgi:hypothetical protein
VRTPPINESRVEERRRVLDAASSAPRRATTTSRSRPSDFIEVFYNHVRRTVLSVTALALRLSRSGLFWLL